MKTTNSFKMFSFVIAAIVAMTFALSVPMNAQAATTVINGLGVQAGDTNSAGQDRSATMLYSNNGQLTIKVFSSDIPDSIAGSASSSDWLAFGLSDLLSGGGTFETGNDGNPIYWKSR